jgi:hypothetical protein
LFRRCAVDELPRAVDRGLGTDRVEPGPAFKRIKLNRPTLLHAVGEALEDIAQVRAPPLVDHLQRVQVGTIVAELVVVQVAQELGLFGAVRDGGLVPDRTQTVVRVIFDRDHPIGSVGPPIVRINVPLDTKLSTRIEQGCVEGDQAEDPAWRAPLCSCSRRRSRPGDPHPPLFLFRFEIHGAGHPTLP